MGPKLLRRFAQSHGLSAEDIAIRLDPKPERQTIIRWWKGSRRPDADHRLQLSRISENEIPVEAWLTTDEIARNKWLEQHPTPGTIRFRKRLGDLKTLDQQQGTTEIEEDVFATLDAAEAESEVSASPEISEESEDDSDAEPEPEPPKPAKKKKEKAREAPPLPKHDHCAAADPVARLSDLKRERFEVIDAAGNVLLTSNDFCAAKQSMDDGEIAGATSVRCKDCKADLARVSTPAKGATEGLVKVANRAGYRTTEVEL